VPELVILVVALLVAWALLGHLFEAGDGGIDLTDTCPGCGAKLEQLGWLGTIVFQDGKKVEDTNRTRLMECPECLGSFREEPDGTFTPH
jgi:hypothetical protein